jgi:hypothetical protein
MFSPTIEHRVARVATILFQIFLRQHYGGLHAEDAHLVEGEGCVLDPLHEQFAGAIIVAGEQCLSVLEHVKLPHLERLDGEVLEFFCAAAISFINQWALASSAMNFTPSV